MATMENEIKAVRKSNYKHKVPDYYIYEAVNPPKARPSAVGSLNTMVGNFAIEGLDGWVFSPFYPYLMTDGVENTYITDCKTEEQAIARGLELAKQALDKYKGDL